MNSINIRHIFLTLAVVFAAHGSCFAADKKHDWNLGATGLRGWIRCDKMVTSDAREITITKVENGSPADGVLAVGDVILGVGGKRVQRSRKADGGSVLCRAAGSHSSITQCARDVGRR